MARPHFYIKLEPVTQSAVSYVKLSSKDMVLFRFLLEAYDNLAMITVLEPKTTLVKILYSPHEKSRLDSALYAIQDAISLEILENPFA